MARQGYNTQYMKKTKNSIQTPVSSGDYFFSPLCHFHALLGKHAFKKENLFHQILCSTADKKRNKYRTNKCVGGKKLNSGINSSCVYFNLQQFFLHTDIQSQQFALLLCLNNKALSKIITYT